MKDRCREVKPYEESAGREKLWPFMKDSSLCLRLPKQVYHSVSLYFKVSLLQCNYTFKY